MLLLEFYDCIDCLYNFGKADLATLLLVRKDKLLYEHDAKLVGLSALLYVVRPFVVDFDKLREGSSFALDAHKAYLFEKLSDDPHDM